MKMIVAERLRAKSLANQQKQQKQRVLPQQPGTQQLSSGSSSSSGQSRPVRMLRG
jgi:hypothetical protein